MARRCDSRLMSDLLVFHLPAINLPACFLYPKEAEIRSHHLWRLMAGVRVRPGPEKGRPNGILSPQGVEIGEPSSRVAKGLHPERLNHHYKYLCIIRR